MSPRSNKKDKHVFRPFLGLVSWWKGRHYYFPTHDYACDETSARSGDNRLGHPHSRLRVDRRSTQQNLPLLLSLPFNIDSLQDSAESMDSVTNSCWEPGDEISQTTTPASNTCYKPDVMIEHLRFLGRQTQPSEVQSVARL